jgi:hypothetical protein
MTPDTHANSAEKIPAGFSHTANLLDCFKLAPIDPESQDLDEGHFMEVAPPLGRSELYTSLGAHPWLAQNLAHSWPGGSDSPHINACAACARVITTALCLETTNPEDLAYALSLPRAFVYALRPMLDVNGWNDLLANLSSLPDLKSENCTAAVTTFLHGCDSESMFLLRVLGPSLYGSDQVPSNRS